MDFTNQINELVAKRDDAINRVTTFKDNQSMLRNANGRLKRTQTAFEDNDISVDVTIDDVQYDCLSATLQAIINNNTALVTALQAGIDAFNVDIKTYDKAIKTLQALTEMAA